MVTSTIRRFFFIQPKIISKKTTLQFIHPPETCYEIISKIEDYPKFVSWIEDAQLLTTNDKISEYFITIGFPPFTQSYTSQVIHDPPHKLTLLSSKNEVFELLESIWEFNPSEKSEIHPTFNHPILCDGHYSVRFKFASPIYQKFSHVVINKLFSETSKAFVKYVNQAPLGVNIIKSRN